MPLWMRPIVAVTKTKYVGRRKRGFEGKAFKQNFVVVYIELDNQLPEVQKNSGFLTLTWRQSSKQRSDQDLRKKMKKNSFTKNFF